jgi:anti-anti-sigma factor
MHHDKTADVHIGVALTASTCQDIRSLVRAALAGHDVVRLWLDEVQELDAPGLGLLMGLHRLARDQDATLICVNASPRLMVFLRKVGLHRVLHLQLIVPERTIRLDDTEQAEARCLP